VSGVFQNIDSSPPHRPASAYPRLWCGGRTHSLGGEGLGANNSEDARHCSVLYICKYFVAGSKFPVKGDSANLLFNSVPER
jgi:hypothetical protein